MSYKNFGVGESATAEMELYETRGGIWCKELTRKHEKWIKCFLHYDRCFVVLLYWLRNRDAFVF